VQRVVRPDDRLSHRPGRRSSEPRTRRVNTGIGHQRNERQRPNDGGVGVERGVERRIKGSEA